MRKKIKAIYENGLIRPLRPLKLPEGARLIVLIDQEAKEIRNAAKTLAEIAALPLESATDAFAGRDHDLILYPSE